jgi:hypothetical protein
MLHICIAGIGWAQGNSAELSVRKIVEHYCELNSKGKILDAGGWIQMEELLSKPDTPRKSPIWVVSHYDVNLVSVKDDTADVIVEYTVIGKINNNLIFEPFAHSNLPPGEISSSELQVKFHLAKQNDGAHEWRISEVYLAPLVLVSSAIEYLEDVRKVDPISEYRVNAEKSIAILRNSLKP